MEGCRWGITQRVSNFQINVWERLLWQECVHDFYVMWWKNKVRLPGCGLWISCHAVLVWGLGDSLPLYGCLCVYSWVFLKVLKRIFHSNYPVWRRALKMLPWKLDICRLRIHRNCICIAFCSCILKHTQLTCVLCAWQGESAALPEEPEAESCWLVPLETFITGAVQHDLLHRYANTQSTHKTSMRTSMFSESVISVKIPDLTGPCNTFDSWNLTELVWCSNFLCICCAAKWLFLSI